MHLLRMNLSIPMHEAYPHAQGTGMDKMGT